MILLLLLHFALTEKILAKKRSVFGIWELHECIRCRDCFALLEKKVFLRDRKASCGKRSRCLLDSKSERWPGATAAYCSWAVLQHDFTSKFIELIRFCSETSLEKTVSPQSSLLCSAPGPRPVSEPVGAPASPFFAVRTCGLLCVRQCSTLQMKFHSMLSRGSLQRYGTCASNISLAPRK